MDGDDRYDLAMWLAQEFGVDAKAANLANLAVEASPESTTPQAAAVAEDFKHDTVRRSLLGEVLVESAPPLELVRADKEAAHFAEHAATNWKVPDAETLRSKWRTKIASTKNLSPATTAFGMRQSCAAVLVDQLSDLDEGNSNEEKANSDGEASGARERMRSVSLPDTPTDLPEEFTPLHTSAWGNPDSAIVDRRRPVRRRLSSCEDRLVSRRRRSSCGERQPGPELVNLEYSKVCQGGRKDSTVSSASTERKGSGFGSPLFSRASRSPSISSLCARVKGMMRRSSSKSDVSVAASSNS